MHLLVEGPVNYSAAMAPTASPPTSADLWARTVIASSTASIFPADSVASKGIGGSKHRRRGIVYCYEKDRAPLEGNAHRSRQSCTAPLTLPVQLYQQVNTHITVYVGQFKTTLCIS